MAAEAETVTPHDVVAGNIRAEMARQRITRARLIDLLGWTRRRLDLRLTAAPDAVTLTVDEVVEIARALAVPLAQLMDGADHETVVTS
jgi:hypothetical protein